MGAWIETRLGVEIAPMDFVAPYMGAWIETWCPKSLHVTDRRSLPTWGRGLKPIDSTRPAVVAGRSLHGGVD